MMEKAAILARLQRDLLSLQGFKPATADSVDAIGLQSINQSFPNGMFPFAALHEFYFSNPEEATASSAFVTGLLSSRIRTSGAALWISTAQKIFPPALKAFGVNPHQVIFLQLKREKELAWAVEEALKCKALAAVVSELPTLSFTESRRFQLAIEQSGVSCFVLRRKPANPATTAVTRWQVKPKNSRTEEGLPGVGHPSWNVALLKVRNGKPGIWDIEWVNGTFRQVSKLSILQQTLQKKTG